MDKKCACGCKTNFVTVTPPADIRPAFPYDIQRINEVSVRQFGKKMIGDGEIAVYNKAPYDDRMEEIICGGEVIGTIRFEIDKPGWVLLPRLTGARRIFNKDSKTEDPDAEKNLKNWIMVHEKAIPFVADGSSVLVPGILRTAPGFEKEDEVVVVTPDFEIIAAGRAKMSSDEIENSERGKAVKIRWNMKDETEKETEKGEAEKIEAEKENTEKKKAKSGIEANSAASILPPDKEIPEGTPVREIWQKTVDANRHVIDKFEADSIRFMQNAANNMSRKLTCSYSGGKDSLVTLQLTEKAFGKDSGNEREYEIIFADTGLEFQETIDNVKEVVEIYGKPFKETSAGNAFWEEYQTNGPPSVDNRWCTQSCKLQPITNVIEMNYADDGGCMTFIGQRQYESKARAKSQRIWKSPSVRGQIGAAPIQEWTAMHVWLYIFDQNLHYNPLYEKGLDRIGCWLCPAASLADFENLKTTHPEAMEMWEGKLIEAGREKGIENPENWVKFGLWRYDRLPPLMQKLAAEKGVKYKK
ncbi:phosphoadenosine phosphosulfate reductase family protein [Methanimicrococcus hacksteinii]|uniref:phosphoadenosine phosphosulfate reductase domain-containing protein n=1 Tax=Methanimicrococcus hacksteinii TaxID=3028293 RepID=UPI00298EDBA0|nr:phosphoadenosine phosphosulfate reductase family protein [Methanimicrococcus sp. At1]